MVLKRHGVGNSSCRAFVLKARRPENWAASRISQRHQHYLHKIVVCWTSMLQLEILLYWEKIK